jgi:mediator of RNA polymerase II transcription subunit 12
MAVFKIASELSLPICQVVIEYMFSSASSVDVDAANSLSAALLDAVRIAVEEDQSHGLELLTTLDMALTDKVNLYYKSTLYYEFAY